MWISFWRVLHKALPLSKIHFTKKYRAEIQYDLSHFKDALVTATCLMIFDYSWKTLLYLYSCLLYYCDSFLSVVSLLGSWLLVCLTTGCCCDHFSIESSFLNATCGSRNCVPDWPPPGFWVHNWVTLACLQQILCCLSSTALFLWVTSAGLRQFIACQGVDSTMFFWYLVATKNLSWLQS